MPIWAIQYVGIAVVAAAGLHVGLTLIRALRRTFHEARQQRLSLALLEERVESVRKLRQVASERAALSWSGYRKFVVVRKEFEDVPARLGSSATVAAEAERELEPPLTGSQAAVSAKRGVPQLCSFYLAPHDGKPLPPFEPGQYLTFRLKIPDQDRPIIRCYSLSDRPQPDRYRVTIKRVPPPRNKPGVPPGRSSNFFHDHVREADILDVQAPRGNFCCDPFDDRPVVLIGGGIGVTPVLSMLNSLTEGSSSREIWFFYGVRNSSEHIMREHLRSVAKENSKVHLNVCYSDPSPDEVEGRDYDHSERVSVDLMKRLLPSNNYVFYTCGPPPMMESITRDLKAWGVAETGIHYEAFGPATVKKTAPKAAPVEQGASAQPAFKIDFARTGRVCNWDGSQSSLLDFAEEHGVAVEAGCRAGNCGTCLTALISGDVTYNIEPGAKPDPGTCLTCVAVPKGISNSTLEADHAKEANARVRGVVMRNLYADKSRGRRWATARTAAPILLFLIAPSWVGADTRVHVGGAAADPAKVVGPKACGECHVNELAAWQGTHHYATFAEIYKRPTAKEISKKMGGGSIRRNPTCLTCHFTVGLKNEKPRAMSGVSCESCHGQAADWIDIHSDFGGEGVKKEAETAEHRQARHTKMEAAGMLRPSNLYAAASNCYQCHTVPNEELLNVGGHTPRSDFELVSWSQGEVRHNYQFSADNKNRPASAEHKRLLYVTGRALDVEYSLRAAAKATTDGAYHQTTSAAVKAAIVQLKKVQEAQPLPEVEGILAAATAVELGLGNGAALTAAADQASAAAKKLVAGHDGSKLAAIDALLPAASTYHGEAAE